MIDRDYLKQCVESIGFSISDEQIEKFYQYSKILVEWNNKMNLTAITDKQGIVVKHFVDSILLLKAYQIAPNSSLIDIGSGAGFPAIPVKIMRDDINITLVDSLNKRITFLKELSKSLILKSECIHIRAEQIGHQRFYRENYDVATARAVSNISVLSEYCLPLVKVGGYFILLKGSDIQQELDDGKKAINILGGEIKDIKKYILPDNSIRNIILVKKISQTATKYPRNASKIKKTPIK